MPIYQRAGHFPRKRHLAFRRGNGQLYHEEFVGTEGFSGISSLVYHLYPPTRVMEFGQPFNIRPKAVIEDNLQARSFVGWDVKSELDFIQSRKIFFFNSDLSIGMLAPAFIRQDYFFKNADADELYFVHTGSGTLQTMYGDLPFAYGDYILIPRGTIYKFEFDDADSNRLLLIESFGHFEIPERYRNNKGQFLEFAPFCERDIKLPSGLKTHDEEGEFPVMIKKRGLVYPYVYANHPFDVIGYDGYCFPWAMSIFDFEPVTGRNHMPPPVHQHFQSQRFVICSILPGLYDDHSLAIPAPYHHSNINSDELFYYVEGDFMIRNNVGRGQFTLHPGGIPHGPHPGAIKHSIGKKENNVVAVMIDPLSPLKITSEALSLELRDYYKSWLSLPFEV